MTNRKINERAVVIDLNMRQPVTTMMQPTETALIHKVSVTLGIPYKCIEITWDEDDELNGGEFWSAKIRLGRFDIKE